jgi:hypothetical protein
MPVILERLRGTSVRMNKIAASLTDEQLRHHIGNKWSIQEHMGHLADLEDLHTGRVADFLAKRETLRPADMTNAKTNESSHNERKIEDILRDFRDKRENLISCLMKLDDEVQLFQSMHPRLQVKMRPIDMAYFTAEHDDHHLTTVREIMTTF